MKRSAGRRKGDDNLAVVGRLGSLVWPDAAARRQALVKAYNPDEGTHTVLVERVDGPQELNLAEYSFEMSPVETWHDEVVGKAVMVCWTNEEPAVWYEGKILAYDRPKRKFEVHYVSFDDTKEHIRLPDDKDRRAVLKTNAWRAAHGFSTEVDIAEMHAELQAAATPAAKQLCAVRYGQHTAMLRQCAQQLEAMQSHIVQLSEQAQQLPELPQHMDVDCDQRPRSEPQCQDEGQPAEPLGFAEARQKEQPVVGRSAQSSRRNNGAAPADQGNKGTVGPQQQQQQQHQALRARAASLKLAGKAQLQHVAGQDVQLSTSPEPEAEALRRPDRPGRPDAYGAGAPDAATTRASRLPLATAAAAQPAAPCPTAPAPTSGRKLSDRPAPELPSSSAATAGLTASSPAKRGRGRVTTQQQAASPMLHPDEQQPEQEKQQQQRQQQQAKRGRTSAAVTSLTQRPAKRQRLGDSHGTVPQGDVSPTAPPAQQPGTRPTRRVAAAAAKAVPAQQQGQAEAGLQASEDEQADDGAEEGGDAVQEEEGQARMPAALQPLMEHFLAVQGEATTKAEQERNMEAWALRNNSKVNRANMFFKLPPTDICKGDGLMFEMCGSKGRGQTGTYMRKTMVLKAHELQSIQQQSGLHIGHYTHVAQHDGKPVTTSCHQCQHQHVSYQCKAGHTSLCNICLKIHYPQMSITAISGGECPQCLGICVCRACLRKAVNYREPSWDHAEQQFFAEYTLTCTGRHILQWYEEETKEAAYDVMTLLDVQQSHEPGDRVCCDRCGTSISNLLRSCSNCHWDICRHCCAELRAEGHWSSSGAANSTHDGAPAVSVHGQGGPTMSEPGPCLSMASGARAAKGRGALSAGATQANSAPPAAGGLAAGGRHPARGKGSGAALAAEATAVQAAHTRSRLAQATFPAPTHAAGAAASPSKGSRHSAHADVGPAAADGCDSAAACTSGLCPGCGEPATFVPQRFFSDAWCQTLEKAAQAYGTKTTLQALGLQPPGARVQDVRMEKGKAGKAAAKAPQRHAGRGSAQQQQQQQQQPAATTSGGQADADPADGAGSGCVYAFQDWVPAAWVRKASCGGDEQYLFTPTADEMRTNNLAKTIFRRCMAHSVPVIVRNVKSRIPWDPQCMQRALNDKRSSTRGGEQEEDEDGMLVVDCSDGHVELAGVSTYDFFNAYKHVHTLEQVLGSKGLGPAGTSSTSTAQDKAAAAAAAGVEGRGKGPPRAKKVRYEALLSKLLKLKDWPPGHAFAKKLQRHNQDFKEMLPCPAWTLFEGSAPLNGATQLPEGFNAPDLGPKTYIAYGMQEEVEDHDVNCGTKLHQDLSSAVNILLHAQREAAWNDSARGEHKVRCGIEEADESTWNGAPAVWSIGRVADADAIRSYLMENVASFSHHGGPVPKELLYDAVYQQAFMLTKKHREALAARGVHLWVFEQHEQEAVFVPAGAPHQVRNMRSCIKVAVDFVPPEAVDQLVALRSRLRLLDMEESNHGRNGVPAVDRTFTDKLQGEVCMLAAAVGAWETLRGKASGSGEGSASE